MLDLTLAGKQNSSGSQFGIQKATTLGARFDMKEPSDKKRNKRANELADRETSKQSKDVGSRASAADGSTQTPDPIESGRPGGSDDAPQLPLKSSFSGAAASKMDELTELASLMSKPTADSSAIEIIIDAVKRQPSLMDLLKEALQVQGSQNLGLGFHDPSDPNQKAMVYTQVEEEIRLKYETRLTKLREKTKQYEQLVAGLAEQHVDIGRRVDNILESVRSLKKAEESEYIAKRISAEAGNGLACNEEALNLFRGATAQEAFVISIDLRGSTSLMLKAKTPKDFANFLDELCKTIEQVVKANHGVFDKFTGDGVLAFFPKFFSGEDAGYYVLKTAIQCHSEFQRIYKKYRVSFTSVPVNAGFGVGVDFGNVHFLSIADGLTVVGIPVVYACRLGGAAAGLTLLNQPAYDEIKKRGFYDFMLIEDELEFKGEGPMLAYRVDGEPAIDPNVKPPGWQSFSQKTAETSAECQAS
jgi:class 3 adenylate cyclase